MHDDASGLTYMQARYYHPVTGRFLSNDPVGFAEGGPAYFNRYAYTANDPVNKLDPDGGQWVDLGGKDASAQMYERNSEPPKQGMGEAGAYFEATMQDTMVATGDAGVNSAITVGVIAFAAADPSPMGETTLAARAGGVVGRSTFKEGLKNSTSQVAITAATEGVSMAVSLPRDKLVLPSYDSPATGSFDARVGVASNLQVEGAKIDIGRNALNAQNNPSPKSRIGKAVDFIRNALQLTQ